MLRKTVMTGVESYSPIDASQMKTGFTEDDIPLTARPSWFVIQITAIASLGGILFGYDLGVISGALPQLIQTFDLSDSQSELVVSILYLGGGVGACVGGPLCDTCGRKRTILLTDGAFLLGAALLYAAPNLSTVVLGRIVVGFAVAVSGIADVSYLHEIAPPQFRGAIVSVNEACISLGFLLAFCAGALLSDTEGQSHDGWRLMFGISGIIALLQFIGMWNMPESPKWLHERGRVEEGEWAMRRIHSQDSLSAMTMRNDSVGNITTAPPTTSSDSRTASGSARHTTALDSPRVYNDYQTMSPVPSSRNTKSNNHETQTTTYAETSPDSLMNALHDWTSCQFFMPIISSLRELRYQMVAFGTTTFTQYRRQAYITLFLAITQQLCGQTNVINYAPLIFASAAANNRQTDDGDIHDDSLSYVRGWTTLSIGLVKFAVTVLVVWKIERIGRRFLLLSGMATIAVGLFCLMLAFGSGQVDAENVASNSGFSVLALPGVLLIVCGYSMSFGPLTWLLTSELFPTDIRGRALGASTIVTYVMASMVTYTFLSFQSMWGPSTVFAMYLSITIAGLVFAFLAVPDTGNKNVNEIEAELDQMYWWKIGTSNQADRNSLVYSDTSDMENDGVQIQSLHETHIT